MNWINVGLEMTNTGKAKTKCKKVLIGPKFILTVKNSDWKGLPFYVQNTITDNCTWSTSPEYLTGIIGEVLF